MNHFSSILFQHTAVDTDAPRLRERAHREDRATNECHLRAHASFSSLDFFLALTRTGLVEEVWGFGDVRNPKPSYPADARPHRSIGLSSSPAAAQPLAQCGVRGQR